MARRQSTEREIGPAGNTDYIEPGSDRHAAILQLKEAIETDIYVLADTKGRKWALTDATAFGPQVTEAYLREVLRQRVAELGTSQPTIQSRDPFEVGYAPAMIVPPPARGQFGIPNIEEAERAASRGR